MGLAKQLKDEIADCPPILVLTGRPDDAWLASWSRAEAAVPHPIDPIGSVRPWRRCCAQPFGNQHEIAWGRSLFAPSTGEDADPQ